MPVKINMNLTKGNSYKKPYVQVFNKQPVFNQVKRISCNFNMPMIYNTSGSSCG
jgi:hypothetical protein